MPCALATQAEGEGKTSVWMASPEGGSVTDFSRVIEPLRPFRCEPLGQTTEFLRPVGHTGGHSCVKTATITMTDDKAVPMLTGHDADGSYFVTDTLTAFTSSSTVYRRKPMRGNTYEDFLLERAEESNRSVPKRLVSDRRMTASGDLFQVKAWCHVQAAVYSTTSPSGPGCV